MDLYKIIRHRKQSAAKKAALYRYQAFITVSGFCIFICIQAAVIFGESLCYTDINKIGQTKTDKTVNTMDAFEEIPGKAAAFLADISAGKIIFMSNDKLILNTSVPFGSLIKPFTLYYGLSSRSVDLKTVYYCRHSKITDPPYTRCWFTPGHGRLNAVQALTESCNRSFMKMASNIDYDGFVEFINNLGFDTNRIAAVKNPMERRMVMTGLKDYLVESPGNLALRLTALLEGTLFYIDENSNLEVEKFVTLDSSAVETVKKGMGLGMVKGHSKPKNSELFVPLKIIGKTGTIGAFDMLDSGCTEKNNNGFFVALFEYNYRKYLLAVVFPCGIGDDAASAGRAMIARFISSLKAQ